MPVPFKQTRQKGDYTVEFTTRATKPITVKSKTGEVIQKGPAYLLIDNYGHICGVFSKQEYAEQAMPAIKKTIVAEYKRRDKNGRA